MSVISIELDARVRARIGGNVSAAGPREACGLLAGYVEAGCVRVRRALPCRNVAPAEARGHRFEIDPRAVLNVRRALRPTGQSIVGFYHSHPDGSLRPSLTDMEYLCLWPDTVWLIVSGRAGSAGDMRAWWLDASPVGAARELSFTNGTPSNGIGCT
ncbi:MAG: M67 family metallopeptidase [Gemmatimonadota bacterium]